jgi:hypothetical protein
VGYAGAGSIEPIGAAKSGQSPLPSLPVSTVSLSPGINALLSGAELRFSALWSMAPDKAKPTGVTGGLKNPMLGSDC